MPPSEQRRVFGLRRTIFFIVTLSFTFFVLASWLAGGSPSSDVQQDVSHGSFSQSEVDYNDLIRRANTTDPYVKPRHEAEELLASTLLLMGDLC